MWQTPATDWPSKWLGDDVVWDCTVADVTNVVIYRRGKLLAQHPLPSLNCDLVPGKDGSLVYFGASGGTNEPITFCSKKGVVARTVPLPEMDKVWTPVRPLNGNLFYAMTEQSAQSHTMYAYKLGSTVTFQGSVAITSPWSSAYDTTGLDNKSVFFSSMETISPWQSMVMVYDPKLKNLQWSILPGPGSIDLVGNGVFCRTSRTASSTSLQLFNKKGVIATHVFGTP